MGRIKVAVGVIYSPDGQEILIAQRPGGRDRSSYWEFPGGKIETHEDAVAALRRELLEEINIEVIKCTPLLEYDYDYDDHGYEQVRLYVHQVSLWQGELAARENQPIKWVRPEQLLSVNMLSGNMKIIDSMLHTSR